MSTASEILSAGLPAAFPHLHPTCGRAANEHTIDVALEQYKPLCLWLNSEHKVELVQMLAADERPIDGTFRVYAIFRAGAALLVIRTPVTDEFPSLTPDIPAAHWYEREIQDMFGLTPVGHPDPRPLVLHGDWPRGLHPLRKDFPLTEWPEPEDRPPLTFIGVGGHGVAEVPVGPIHAGIIEPGHFRFGTLGENVIRLEAQLFYTHRGLEKRAEGMDVQTGLYLAERICGACALSHATAYAQAVERLSGAVVPERAQYLRMLALEMERLYNHVGDIGNLCAGAAFAFGNSQGMRLKELLLQLNERVWGHRFLRGIVALGGVRRDLGDEGRTDIRRTLDQLETEWHKVIEGILGSGIFMDRVRRTGVLAPEIARALGAVGVAGRASGVDVDLRRDLPYLAYDRLRFRIPVYQAGDVASRMQVRLVESFESISLIRQILDRLPRGPIVAAELPEVPANASSVGYVESPRGSDFHFVMTGGRGEIYRYMVRSASYPNWAVVPYAVPGNLVVDFPLINKSFELCYACLDR